MKAQEIRKAVLRFVPQPEGAASGPDAAGPGEGSPSYDSRTFFLGEIAAQIAETNERLIAINDWLEQALEELQTISTRIP